MTNRRNFMAGAAAFCLAAPARAAAPPGLIIENVTVLPMTGTAPISGASVVITGGRIAAIRTHSSDPRPRGHTRIDASGKYLMPGLTDAHAHLESDQLLKFFLVRLRAGITPEPVRA